MESAAHLRIADDSASVRDFSAPSAAVRVADVSKAYGDSHTAVLALDHIDLSVAHGEFVCLLGASGFGKSSLLNLFAGLDQAVLGRVDVDGRSGLMFQESALFPWLTVRANVELALRFAKVAKGQRKERVLQLLEMVHLGQFANKRPHELSGGMRQRVALARALAQDADVLLMDEPFGALDAMTRDLLHEELERLWLARKFTCVFVTHNVREAVRLGDRVVLLTSRPGRVAETYHIDVERPRRIDSPEVATMAATITDRLREEVARHGK
ncbi:MAG TPA: ABC transporter ATP-binding protein [Acidimicrobiia bacterium]